MSKEFRIGLLALVSGVLLYTGFNFLKGTDFFSRTQRYYAILPSVNGLTISNPVMLNGLNVGRVSDIQILQSRGNKMLIALDIRKDLQLYDKSLAILADNGLLGGKMIDLKVNAGKVLNGGDTLKSQILEGMMADLTKKADPLITKTDSIMNQILTVMRVLVASKESIVGVLDDTKGITGSIKNTLSNGELNQLLHNMNVLSASLVELERQFKPIVGKMDNITDRINQIEIDKTMQQANQSIASINQLLAKVNSGQGTFGALMNNDSLYRSLNNATRSADRLMIDLRENPKRYVDLSIFGSRKK